MNYTILGVSKVNEDVLKLPSKDIPLDIDVLDFTLYNDYEMIFDHTTLLSYRKLTNVKKIILGNIYPFIILKHTQPIFNFLNVSEIIINIDTIKTFFNPSNIEGSLFFRHKNLSKIIIFNNIDDNGNSDYIIKEIVKQVIPLKNIKFLTVKNKNISFIDELVKQYNRMYDLKIEILD